MTSTLIENGQVYDHISRSFKSKNILLKDGVIQDISPAVNAADEVIDASGSYLSAGFIDLHCHIFNHPLFSTSRLNADRIGVGQGVACLVDAGSAGPATIDAFKEFVIDTQQTAAFTLANIGSPGLPNITGGHSSRPELVSLAGTVKAIERHPEWIRGVKVLASASHSGLLGIDAVKIGRKAADLTGTPLMVHLGNAPPIIEDILALLKPGDILTHAYHGKIGGVLGYKDKIIPEFTDAVNRGVIIDIAHGRSSFAYSTCEKAMDQGMPVHTISSDLHRGNVDRYVVSLARTMSKFRLLGLSLAEVVHAVTWAPATALGLQEFGFGSLEIGQAANLTQFHEHERSVDVEDAEGEIRTTRTWIKPCRVWVKGRVFEPMQPL